MSTKYKIITEDQAINAYAKAYPIEVGKDSDWIDDKWDEILDHAKEYDCLVEGYFDDGPCMLDMVKMEVES